MCPSIGHPEHLRRARPSRRGPAQPEQHHAEPTTLRYRLLHIAARITKAPAFTGRHLRREGLEGEHHKQVAGCLAALPDREVDRARDVEVVGQHLEHCGLRCCVDVRLARGDP